MKVKCISKATNGVSLSKIRVFCDVFAGAAVLASPFLGFFSLLLVVLLSLIL